MVTKTLLPILAMFGSVITITSCQTNLGNTPATAHALPAFKRFSFAFNPIDMKKFDELFNSYQPSVSYINTNEPSPVFPRITGSIKTGDIINVGTVRKLPKVKFGLDFFNDNNKTCSCSSGVVNLSIVNGDSINLPLECQIYGTTPHTITINPIIITEKTTINVGLIPSNINIAQKAFAMAIAGTLSMHSEGMYGETPINSSLVFMPSASRTNPAVQIIFAIADKNNGNTILQVNSDDTDYITMQSFLNGTLENGILLNGQILNDVKAPDTGIITKKLVDTQIKIKSSRGAERVIVDNDLQIRIPITGEFVTIDHSVQANTEMFSGEFLYSETQNGIPSTISIATYNVQGMADDSGKGVPKDFQDVFSNWIKDKIYNIKAKNIATALELSGSPDVVALQEMKYHDGNSHILDIMWPYLSKLGYKYRVLGAQRRKGPRNFFPYDTEAIISKYPIIFAKAIEYNPATDDSIGAARDPLMAVIDVGGTTFRVYTMHAKSKREQGDAALGDALRKEMLLSIKADMNNEHGVSQNTDFIVLGDMNASYYEAPIMEGLNATGDESKMLASDNSELSMYNLWYDIPKEKRCNMAFQGLRDCIDNILVSSSLYDNNGLQYIDNSFTWASINPGNAYNGLMNADGTGFRWQTKTTTNADNTKYTTHLGMGFSDHQPIVASFKVLGNTGDNSRMTLQSPASLPINHAPDELKIHIPYCTNENGEFYSPSTAISLTTDIDLSTAANMNTCFFVNNGNIPLQIVDAYDTRFDIGFEFKGISKLLNKVSIAIQWDDMNINGRKIGHDAILAKFIEQVKPALDAKKAVFLTGFKGRLGMTYGKLTLFAEELPQVRVE